MKKLYLLIIFILLLNIANGQTITTIIGTGTAGFSGDYGPASAAELNSPVTLSWGGSGSQGNLYIADGSNYRIRELKLGVGGIIMTIAGDGVDGYCCDGGPATGAEISVPAGVTIDKHFNVYIGDISIHRIRKVDIYGNITTYGGTGVAGFSGEGGPATNAMMNGPYNVVVDTFCNLYFADLYNHRIRKIDTSGIITTVVGNGTAACTGDGGPASAAEISYPNFLSIDALGQLYITDNGNHKIRKIDIYGNINTIAGTGVGGYSGDGGPATAAQLKFPAGTAIDKFGNFLIADAVNNRIRQINPVTGIITTLAGTGVTGSSGDGGPATAAELNQPHGIVVDKFNNIYFADRYNNKIRKISGPPVAIINEKTQEPTVQVYPNPTNGTVNVEWANEETGMVTITVFNILGQVMHQKMYNINSATGNLKLNLSDLQDGVYLVSIKSEKINYFKSLLISK